MIQRSKSKRTIQFLSAVNDNIKFAVQTHSKTNKKVTQLKHSIATKIRTTIIDRRVMITIIVTIIIKTRDYHKRRTKKRSTVYIGRIQTASMERAERRERELKRKFVLSAHRIKFSPYEQVNYTVNADVDIIRVRSVSCYMSAAMLQRNNTRHLVDGTCLLYTSRCV